MTVRAYAVTKAFPSIWQNIERKLKGHEIGNCLKHAPINDVNYCNLLLRVFLPKIF